MATEDHDFKPGDLVWFEPGIGYPLPGEILEVHEAAQIIIVGATIDGKPQTFTLASKSEGNLSFRQQLGHDGVEDLTQLEDLHEASILWNLRGRYDSSQFYTYVGSILISVNPYTMHPDLYGLEMAKKYAGAALGQLPPHLFAIGQAAYSALVNQRQNQAIVISGESGSGKTESNKLIMQYLAAIVPGGGMHSNKITEQILEASPLLESFGNAKTSKNDNSSRFGKYLEVYFKSGAIIGAKITQYLLEKSRIVTQSREERNYHIFYELLSGLNEADRTKYGLLQADKYFYLNQGSSDCAPNGSCKEWSSLQGAMQVLGFSEIEREGIIRVLASVLHLGNVYFHRKQLRHSMEGVELGSDGAECKWASYLLEISSEGLIRSLKTRLTETRNELLYTPLTIDQALDARDAFAKALYSGLFNWLVSRVNSIIHKGGTHDAHRMSILDIFGFESLEENSFEQLCINYANESLQLYFNKHNFKMEQAEYAKERLEWEHLDWEDNLPVIHLLAKKPVGIFHLLDDESNFPRASDASFLEKCHYNHALNELYNRPRIGANEFGITHFAAGLVWYNVDGFLEKNRDALRPEVLELLASSSLPLVQDMTKQLRAQREGKTLPRNSNGRFVTMKPRTPTVSARFSDSLQQLLTSMSKCNPWFVRCIKPNHDKQAKKVDMPCLLNQLRFLGILSTVKIRKQGYPVRLRFQHFVERYRHLLRQPIPRGTPYRDLCRMVLDSLSNLNEHDYQLGATRVFLRETLHRRLEFGRNDRLHRAATIIQKKVRKALVSRKVQRQEKSAIILQKTYRGYRERKRYQDLRKGVVTAQALFRGKKERRRFERIKTELKRREVESSKKERIVQRAVQKTQSSERNSILQLDVPAELAFIFTKIEGWNQIHGDRNLVKVVGTVPGPPIASELPKDLEQFAFGKFSSVYCNGIQLHPRRDPISTPFLSRSAAKDKDYQDSLSLFKLILRWMGDPSLDANKDKILADYIVNKGLQSRTLRDEILVQLCNQVYGVEENQSSRIWQLMSHCLSSFQPGAAFSKYLMKFIKDNAPPAQRELLLKKILRSNNQSVRLYPPTYLEWRAAKQSDVALGLTLPDGTLQTVAIDAWTTCEEAASLSLAMIPGFQTKGWTVVLDDMGTITDTCGIDYVLDLIGEKELCPAFPAGKNDVLRMNRKNMQTPLRSPRTPTSPNDIEPLKRPLIPPPAPPQQSKMKVEKTEREEISVEYTRNDAPPLHRKTSIDLLSRSSALNERYFEIEKSRSRSLDDLMNSDSEPPPQPEVMEPKQPMNDLGLSGSRLNDRYHSHERLIPMKQPAPRVSKPPYIGKRTSSIQSNKYMDRPDMLVRSSGMSDTSETPSLASHVRRVRVPSQASDVDQFLDDLFSPVLDGNLDELSDARSLAASIRGDGFVSYSEAPILDDDVSILQNANGLCRIIKGGEDDDDESSIIKDAALEEYITDLFQPIFMNENIRNLAEKEELADAIRGGGGPGTSEPYHQQQNVQRAFLESAMEQNIKIQQQLIAQNEALQTLLHNQGEGKAVSPSQAISPNGHQSQSQTKTVFKFNMEHKEMRTRKESNDMFPNPPPPPPMPPPLDMSDPFQRPFMDPYGRAKTVRIGKWRWPPPDNIENAEDFIAFKLRQNQRKTTPQSQQHTTYNNGGSPDDHREALEWENYDHSDGLNNVERSKERFKSEPQLNKTSHVNTRVQKRSFDIGADRPGPNAVGKLKLSTEMRQRLEKVTAGHSVRSTTSNKSDLITEHQPVKLDESRKLMLEQQLGGSNVRHQIQRMEASKIQKPFMPLPSIPAPPPPVRPPNSIPPAPPMQHYKEKVPSFVQRMEKDTFGIKDSYNDSWERAEVEQLDMIYDANKRSRSHSRERENFAESAWDRSEIEGPPSNDDTYKSNVRDKSRHSEMSQIQRERESLLVYQPKMTEKEKRIAVEKATFKNHMFSQKDRERKTSTSTVPSIRDKYDDSELIIDDFTTSNIPKPVLGPPMLKTPTACLTYNTRVPWKLKVKKEVFRPNESIGPPECVDFLFAQVATDVMGPSLRISQQEKRHALNLLGSHGVDLENNSTPVRNIVKRQLIEMARTWPLYFSRLFIVNGSPQYPEVTILAVHHTGAFFARKEGDSLVVSKTILFEDLQNVVTLPRPAALQIILRNGNRFVLHAMKAAAVHSFLQSFLHEFKRTQSKQSTGVSTGAKAAAATLNVSMEKLEVNNHSMHHHNGVDESESRNITNGKREETGMYHQNNFGQQKSSGMHHQQESNMNRQEESSPTQTSIVKHSLLQFALQHFRFDTADESPKNRAEKRGPNDRLHANLVKWQGYPLQSPLLKLPMDLNGLALECFECILRYCGDMPQDHNFSEVKCVYTVLMHCHKHLILRDEVYCQLMKQTTANRSTFADSSQRAWRLLSILAAYFGCSEALKPYLIEHLTSAATDRRGTASVCLTNLRKTARCGGRKNVPSVEEVTAVSAGRSARRQIYRLPGGAERVVNTRCSTVVADVISELCSLLGIETEAEQQEFSLYCIVQGDAFTMPLSSDEYILDVTTELLKTNQPFYLIFCRSVWHFPLKKEPAPTPLYIEVLFNQVAPDYLEGLLLEIPNMGTPSPDYVRDIARIAAILHRAADLNHIPVMKEIKFLLPKPALGLREIKPAQWVNLVQAEFVKVLQLTPLQCKAQFLNVLSAWPLFGSSFFAVKRIFGDDVGLPEDESTPMWRELILALNHRGVLFLDSNTHETLHHWQFIEIISTRKVRSEDALFLDMKVGNLLQQNVIRVQTEQAHEISRIIRQYISMATQRDQRSDL